MPTLEWNQHNWNDPDRWKKEWHRGYALGGREAVQRDFLRFVAPLLPSDVKPRILEIACGMGRFTEFLLEVASYVHAIDIIPHCVESCRQRFPERFTATLTDGMTLPNGEFDLILSYDSLVHADYSVLTAYFEQAQDRLADNGMIGIHHANHPDCSSSRTMVTSHMIAQLIHYLPHLALVSQMLFRLSNNVLLDCFTVARRVANKGSTATSRAESPFVTATHEGQSTWTADVATRASLAQRLEWTEQRARMQAERYQALERDMAHLQQENAFLVRRIQTVEAERNHYRRRWPPYTAKRLYQKSRTWYQTRSVMASPSHKQFGNAAKLGLLLTGLPTDDRAEEFVHALANQSRTIDRLVIPGESQSLKACKTVAPLEVHNWWGPDLARLTQDLDYIFLLHPQCYGAAPLFNTVSLEMLVAALASDPAAAAIMLRGTSGQAGISTPNFVHDMDQASVRALPDNTVAALFRTAILMDVFPAVNSGESRSIQRTLLHLLERGYRVLCCPRWFPLLVPPPVRITSVPKAPIRALFVTQWIECGGADKGIVDLLSGVDRHLVDFSLVTTLASEHRWEHRVRDHVRDMVHLGEFLPLPPEKRFPAFLVEYVRRREIGLVHITHSFLGYDALPQLKAAMPQVKILDQCHILEPPHIMEGGHPAYSSRHYKQYLDHRTVTSQWLKRYLMTEHAIPEAQIGVIPTGIDFAEEFNPARYEPGVFRRQWHIPTNAPLVLFMGRLHWQKRPWLFVRIAAEVTRRRPELGAYFVLVGDGSERDRIAQMIRHSTLQEQVLLIGETAHPGAIYRDADLLLMPSGHEGLAYVSYEAMAMGVPQIFTDVNGQSELITPETGMLLPPEDEERVVASGTEAVIRLLDNPDERQAMREAGHKRIRAFGLAQMVAAYEALYRRLLGLPE